MTFLSGSVAGDQVCTDVTATADGVLEEDVEDLVLSLSTTEVRVDISRDTTTVSIVDQDSELTTFTALAWFDIAAVNVFMEGAPTSTVPESAGTVAFAVALSSAAMRDVVVRVFSADGTAQGSSCLPPWPRSHCHFTCLCSSSRLQFCRHRCDICCWSDC